MFISDSPMVISSPNDTDCVVIDSDIVQDPNEIFDIDRHQDKMLGVSDYTQDIYKYLRQAEVIGFGLFKLFWKITHIFR